MDIISEDIYEQKCVRCYNTYPHKPKRCGGCEKLFHLSREKALENSSYVLVGTQTSTRKKHLTNQLYRKLNRRAVK